MNNRRISKLLLFILIINLFSTIIGKSITVKADDNVEVYHSNYTYNEIGVEYEANNKLTVKVEEIQKTEGSTYDTYNIRIRQTNNTTAPINEGTVFIYFHDKEKEATTSFLGVLYPGDTTVKTYQFKVLKDNIPWAIAYHEDFFDNDFSDNLKWDITPEQYKGKSSNIKLNTVETSYGNTIDKISVPSNAETININPIPEDSKATVIGAGVYDLNYGDNVITFEIVSEMGTKKEYSITVRRLSSNANLSSLTFGEGTLTSEFSSDITEYVLKVDKNDISVAVRPYAEDSNAKIRYTSYIYVKADPIIENIVVTAEDGTQKTYTVTVIPPSKDATLKDISLNDGQIPFTFDPSTYRQEVTVNADVTTLKIEGITNNPGATVIEGNGTFELKEGKNEFYMEVQAENPGYRKSYNLIVYKSNNENSLSGIYFGGYSGNLIYGFDPNITEYTIEEIKFPEDNSNKFRFYATPENYKSEVTFEYDGIYKDGYIYLDFGQNVMKIKCTSEQGEVKEYTVTINYREAKNNTKIESITFDKGVMEPAFDPNIKDYTIKVPRDTYQMYVTDIKTEDKIYFIANQPDGAYSARINLNDLDTNWTFKVIAEDRETIDYYNFKIVKTRNSDSTLSNIGVQGGELTPKFDPNIKEYSTTVHSSFEKINLYANATDYNNTTVTGTGEKKLNYGNNKFTITVKAEDGSTSEYTVNIHRNNPPVLTVSDITVPYGDEIDLLKGVKAIDVEDGDITSKVKASPMQWPITAMGTYDISYTVEDSFGEWITKYAKLKVVDRVITIREAIGANRYDTAVKLSNLKHSKSDIAVIVNGTALADGLAVTPLAAYYKAPILLTETNSLPKTSLDELKRLGVKKVIIAGGKGVVSDKVESQLRGVGISSIERLAGNNRYETSLEIAKYIDRNCYDVNQVAVCNGYGEADALSISAVAGRDRIAIIMSDKNDILSSVESWLVGEDLSNAYIIGGTGVVSDAVLNKVNSMTKNNISNNRLGGTDRYHTNAIILDRFYGRNLNTVYMAKGLTLVDALAAGAVAALDNGPVMLVGNDYLTDKQYEMLNNKIGSGIVRAGGGISDIIVEITSNHLKW